MLNFKWEVLYHRRSTKNFGNLNAMQYMRFINKIFFNTGSQWSSFDSDLADISKQSHAHRIWFPVKYLNHEKIHDVINKYF